MTVDEYDMRVRPRGLPPPARRDRSHREYDVSNGVQKDFDRDSERWMALAELRDGQRENWMTDRAKQALGTAKLASVYLEEEKSRILRLRKIKSVLASGNYIGAGEFSKSAHKTYNRCRRPRPQPDTLRRAAGHTERRRQAHLPTVPPPNYPTRPFGNIDKGVLLAATSDTRKIVENRNSHVGKKSILQYATAPVVWDLSSTSPTVESSRRGQGTYPPSSGNGSNGPLVNGRYSREESRASQHTNNTAFNDFRDDSWETPPSATSPTVAAARGLAMSSGASAIDLFDQCGLVPAAAVEFAGLVGTSREACQGTTGSRDLDSPNDGREKNTQSKQSAIPTAVKPPLIPGPSVGIRSRKGRHRGFASLADPANRNARNDGHAAGQPEQSKPPFVGNTSAGQPRSLPCRGMHGRAEATAEACRRGNAGPVRTSGPDPQDAVKPLADSSKEAGSHTRTPNKSSARVRRRWENVENNDAAQDIVQGNGVGGTSGGEADERADRADLAAQRLLSAQARLHKDKGLQALKSEHVEALSILRDISAPSTATAASSEPEERQVAKNCVDTLAAGEGLLDGSTSGIRPITNADNEEQQGGRKDSLDADVDLLSANLPRIESREQAALRLLYRKWWTNVANGETNLPSTPDMLEMMEAGVTHGMRNAAENDALPTGVPASKSSRPSREQRNPASLEHANGVGVDRRGEEELLPSVTVGKSGDTDPGVLAVGRECKRKGDSACRTESTAVLDAGDRGKSASNSGVDSWTKISERDSFNEDRIGQSSNDSKPSIPACLGPVATRATSSKDNLQFLCRNRGSDAAEQVTVANEQPHAGSAATAPDEHTSADRGASHLPCRVHSPSTSDIGGDTTQGDGAVIAKGRSGEPQSDSDVESMSDDDAGVAGEEEGLHGRIYLPDGRFVSTRHDSIKDADTVEEGFTLTGLVASVEGDPPCEYGEDDFED